MSAEEQGEVRFPPELRPTTRGEEPQAESAPQWREAVPDASAGVPAPRRPTGDRVRIGLWGSPTSGKTTFLAALRLAAQEPSGAYGRWQVVAADDVSEAFLIQSSRELTIDRRFPVATRESGLLSWLFRGDLTGSRYARKRFGRSRRANQLEFEFSVLDAPGGHYEDLYQNVDGDRATAHLAASTGLIYLFDPMREAVDGDSFAYLNGTLARLTRRCMAAGTLDGPYLPHHIAVCVTKFDDPEVFERARRGNWTELGPQGTPVVPDPEGFFDWLAQDLHGSTMELIGRAIRSSFHPSRIHFFATSAIGFSTRPGGGVDLGRFGNVHQVGGEPQILGAINPHNVMDPVIALLLGIKKRW
ncbi:hypothetical protein QCN29_10855 [Streptomyces sp. HNM0663]|uniref:Uncharacterized protein n=1 Tax=Streptomyces chengmaiensis TaxID=3040919 RepID=A0ABT6HLR0_9ACTN|nr:hypothetical protein [Streptomyces chengmaiensis]MDH2389281.1 hypothetical protein [Streptomyces chengmaiensis]